MHRSTVIAGPLLGQALLSVCLAFMSVWVPPQLDCQLLRAETVSCLLMSWCRSLWTGCLTLEGLFSNC